MKVKNLIFQQSTGDDMSMIPVMSFEGGQDMRDVVMPDTLPILALRNAVLFPDTIIPITVGREKSVKLVRDVYSKDKILGAVAQKDARVEDPGEGDLFETGTLARIIKIIEMPDGGTTIILQGIKRFKIQDILFRVAILYSYC